MKKENNNKWMYAGGIGITIAFALFIASSYTASAGGSFWGNIQELIAGKTVDKIFSEAPDFSVDNLMLGAMSGPDVYQDMFFHETVQTGGGKYATTSNVATSETLTEADMLSNNYLYLMSNVGAFEWTLPATSTLTSMLKDVGDERSWLVHNATSSSSITLTILAGSGIDLVGVSNATDVLDPAEYGRLTCTRIAVKNAALDVVCEISELEASD